MGSVIGALLVPAAGVAFSPVPLIAAILMLFSPRPRANGVLFAAGFALGLLVLGAVVVALTGASGAGEDGSASDAAYALRIVAGLILLWLAVRKARRAVARDPGAAPDMPRWMASTGRLTPARALGLGAALGGANPKNIVFTLAAAATIAQGGLTTGQEWLALAVFVLAGSSTTVLIVAYRLVAGARAAVRLERWKAWLAANNDVVMGVLFALFGVLLVGQGIAGLTG